MYDILLGKSKEKVDNELVVNVNQQRALAVPPSVALGVGDKQARYRNLLDSCIGNEGKGRHTLNFLAYIHKEAKKGTALRLICDCRYKKFHAAEIKGFLERNRELLDMMLPYLFPNEGYKPKEQDPSSLPQELQHLVGQLPASGDDAAAKQPAAAQLSSDDMAQIQALIKADQAKELLNQTEGSNDA